jgi:DNA modification methylase
MTKKHIRSGTFTDNMKLPVHRWFRYSAGFSAEWVEEEIQNFKLEFDKPVKLLDPFVGSGTSLLAANAANIEAYGFEAHPFIARVAQAKQYWYLDEENYLELVNNVLHISKENLKITQRHDPSNLLGKCYTIDSLSKLDALRNTYEILSNNDPLWELVWLNITSILRPTSGVGTAQWQYVLPNKTKSKIIDPFEAFLGKAEIMASDMKAVKKMGWKPTSKVILQDVRHNIPVSTCNLLLTSPPYPNNYDYADATRLEMMFWGEIVGWKDLQKKVRYNLMRSCSQHSAAERLKLDELLELDELKPILAEITNVTRELEEVRKTKGGKKTYHTMIAAYFYDLARIWNNLRKVMDTQSKICFVIGDSAPYGVHVPADKWLEKLALSAGFKFSTFEKLRDRNIKWKNRTHDVLLLEGRLWIKG